jgi:hypothetical protein
LNNSKRIRATRIKDRVFRRVSLEGLPTDRDPSCQEGNGHILRGFTKGLTSLWMLTD